MANMTEQHESSAEATDTGHLTVAGAQVNAEDIELAIFAFAGRLRGAGADFFADFSRFLLTWAPQCKAQLFQDAFAAFILDSQPSYFIEIGTGEGEAISNTYLLEKQFGWSGMVVEPNPVFLPSLKAKRSCTISTACVFDATGKSITFRCTQEPEFSQVVSGLSDMHQERRMADFTEIEVTTTSLNDLLEQNGCPQAMGFLSLDVEGAEFDILHTFDFDRWSFDALCVEHNYSPAREEIHTLLTEHKYVRVFENFSQWDDWYVHRRMADRHPGLRRMLQEEEQAAKPADAPSFVSWALEAIQRNELAVAETLAERAIGIDPTFGAAYRTLADVAVRGGRRTLARRHWQSALDVDPADTWAHIGMAELLAATGAIPQALDHLQSAVEADPSNSRALELTSKLQSRLGPQWQASQLQTKHREQ